MTTEYLYQVDLVASFQVKAADPAWVKNKVRRLILNEGFDDKGFELNVARIGGRKAPSIEVPAVDLPKTLLKKPTRPNRTSKKTTSRKSIKRSKRKQSSHRKRRTHART